MLANKKDKSRMLLIEGKWPVASFITCLLADFSVHNAFYSWNMCLLLFQIMVAGWIQIRCGIACHWVIPSKAKLQTPLDNVNPIFSRFYDCLFLLF